MDLSFSGAGFMGCYYFGVVNCWNKYIPRNRVRRVAGASAGSLIAAYYLMDLPLDKCLKEIIELTEDVRRRPLGVFDRSNQIVDVLPRALDKIFPDDAHKRVGDRLYVCMTRLKDMKAVTVNEFETKQDLIDALNCSCFIPVWSGNHVATYKGVKHIDGGFTNNLPVFDEHTIRICCFAGASDIAPCDRSQADFMSGSFQGMPFYLNWKNMRRGRRALWPPPPSYIIELLERGFHDAKDFILSNDLIQCERCFKSAELEYQPIHSKIAPTISPAVSRSGSFRGNKSPEKSRESGAAGGANLHNSGSGGEIARLSSTTSLNYNCNDNRELGKLRKIDRQSSASSANVNDNQWRQKRNAAPAVPAIFERRRSKSGKQISLDSLELASQIRQEAALALSTSAATTANQSSQIGGADTSAKSFVGKLRDKLTRKTSKSCLDKLQEQELEQSGQARQVQRVYDTIDDEGEDDDASGRPESPGMPTIVIDQAIREAMMEPDNSLTDVVASVADGEKQVRATPELDTSDHIEPDSKRRHQDSASTSGESASGSSLDSSSSSDVNSDDSAVGLNSARKSAHQTSASPTSQMWTKARPGGSPGDMFLASRRESVAMAHQLSAEFERQQKQQQQQQRQQRNQQCNLMPDRFTFAPSQLPSCPPSPNLNRHCTECIRMRQEARLDEIDESIRQEAAKYGSMGAKEAEKEFSSIKYKIANWFRQFGGTKYYYSFDDDDKDDNETATSGSDGGGATTNSQVPAKGHRAPQASPHRRRASEIPYLS